MHCPFSPSLLLDTLYPRSPIFRPNSLYTQFIRRKEGMCRPFGIVGIGIRLEHIDVGRFVGET
jgi:hypothetical protein